MSTKRFLRRDSHRYPKLGKNRRKNQVWRKPKGRDTQTRLKRKGYPPVVSIGFRNPKASRGRKEGLLPVLVKNTRDLERLDAKNEAIIFSSHLGARKKMDLIKKAEESKIKILNIKGAKNEIRK